MAVPPAYPPGGCRFTNLTATTAGTLIKTGSGILFGMSVNSAGAAGSTVTLYDGTSTAGTKLGTFSTATVPAPQPIPAEGIQLNNGLFVVVASSGAAPDVTVGWY